VGHSTTQTYLNCTDWIQLLRPIKMKQSKWQTWPKDLHFSTKKQRPGSYNPTAVDPFGKTSHSTNRPFRTPQQKKPE